MYFYNTSLICIYLLGNCWRLQSMPMRKLLTFLVSPLLKLLL